MTWRRWGQWRALALMVAVAMGMPVGVPHALAFSTVDAQLRSPAAETNAAVDAAIDQELGSEDTGKTFIAVTAPGAVITPQQRVEIDKKVRAVIGGGFALGQALRVGPDAPPLSEQTKDASLNARVQAVHMALALVAAEAGPVYAELFAARRVVYLTGDNQPALLSEGDLHLIGSSGHFPTTEAPQGSHFVKLSLIELAIQALGKEASDFLRAWVIHETQVLNAKTYVAPSQDDERILNEGFAKIQAYQAQQAAAKAEAARKERIKLAETRAKLLAERVQLLWYGFELGRYYADGHVPDAVVAAIEQGLAEAKTQGEIVDARVKRYDGTVSVQLSYNGPARNPAQDHRVAAIVVNAINGHTDGVQFSEAYQQEFAGRDATEQAATLPFVTGELPYNEREAEPIYAALALGGHVSAFNLPVTQIFLREAVENQQKIEGLDDKSLDKLLAGLKSESNKQLVTAFVQRWREAQKNPTALAEVMRDIMAGRYMRIFDLLIEVNQAFLREEAMAEGPGYVFEIERIKDVIEGKRNRIAYHISTQQAPYIHTLVNDQTEWVITRVLPRAGSKLYDPTKAPLEQDPIVAIAVDRFGVWGNEAFSPVFLGRQQSGAPAVGEFTAGILKFFITVSGNGEFHNGVVPVTEQEADAGTFRGDGRIQMVGLSYESFAKGHIPKGGIQDQVGLANDIRPLRNDDQWVHNALALHGTFQPHTTAPIAMGRAEAAAHALGARYHEIPAAVERKPDGSPVLTAAGKVKVKLDPFLEASNRKAVITQSDLKADIGGEPGHQLPPDLYYATLRASLKAAQRAGLIKGYDVQGIGDDMHAIIFHDKGVDSAEIHTLAWQSFFRSGWALKKIMMRRGETTGDVKWFGYQPYGFMQDLVDPKVAKLIKEGKLEAFANLTDEFIQALEEEIQEFPNEVQYMPSIRAAYEAFKVGKAEGTVIEMGFSGNVRGMGIGFAEKAVSAEEAGLWSIIASDKTGPGSYNFRTYWATRLALDLLRHGAETLQPAKVAASAVVDLLAQRVTHVAGAQTGQVHISSAIDSGATGVLIGHSEISDSAEDIHQQMLAAAERNVRTIILAVGEEIEATDETTQQQRDATLKAQVREALLRSMTEEGTISILNGKRKVTQEELADLLQGRLVVAYEPRWAIGGSGQGRPATKEYAQAAHRVIRETLRELFGNEFADRTRIIYGGSATADNAASYLEQEDIDGLLPGGASTSTAKLLPMLQAAQSVAAAKKAKTGRTLYIAGNQKTYAVKESPEEFAKALAAIDPNLVQVGIAPALSALSDWKNALASTKVTLKGASQEAFDAFVGQLSAKAPDLPDADRQEFAEQLFLEVTRQLTREDLGQLRRAMGNGVAYELWDVRPNTRAFLDAQSEDDQLLTLLSAINEHNIKRMWSKKREGWIQDLTAEELAAIDAKADAALSTLLTELQLRQAQVKADQASGKKFDQLTPWEQQLATKTAQELLPVVQEQYRELLKIQEFVSDDYFMSASTEKLAVAGGGAYLGKDDPTAWILDALAKISRAISQHWVLVTLGNARGSHWVGVRPEGRRTNVAVKWSNPIEGSIRFTVHADGSVPVDEHGRAVSEDMYAGAEYDAARARVARFNERWITVQGGFTPHGPNIEDVEAAYPYATTVRHLTAPDSPFAHPIVDDTAETVQQGKWAGTFNALGYQAYTPGVAKMAVDTAAPQTILVHEGFFSLGPDGPIQVQRFLEYVRQVSGYATIDQAVAHSAVKLIVVFESEVGEPMKPAEANELFRTLIATVNDATDGATSLKPEWFTVATEKPQGAVAVALGPSNWLQTIPQAGVKVTVNEGRSAAAAFSAGIEAAATGGVLAESIKTKLDVDSLAEVGVISPRELKASGQLDTELEHYQTTVRGARGNL